MWCVAQPTDRVRVCCVSSTEAVSTQCHTRSGCSHQGVKSKSVHSTLCVLLLWWAYLCLSRVTQHQMQCAALLNVAVCKGVSVLKLLPCEDKTPGSQALLVLDLLLHVLDSVIRSNLKGECLPIQDHYEDPHALYKVSGVVDISFPKVIMPRALVLAFRSCCPYFPSSGKPSQNFRRRYTRCNFPRILFNVQPRTVSAVDA